MIVVAFLIDRLDAKGWRFWAVLLTSALLRGSYHLYQGFGGFVGNADHGRRLRARLPAVGAARPARGRPLHPRLRELRRLRPGPSSSRRACCRDRARSAFATDLALRRAEGAEIERGPDATIVRMAGNPTFRWGNFLLVPEAGDPAARARGARGRVPGRRLHDGRRRRRARGPGRGRLAVRRVRHRAARRCSRPRMPCRRRTPASARCVSDEDWAAEGRIALELEDAPDDAHVLFTRRRTAEQRRAVDRGRAGLARRRGGRRDRRDRRHRRRGRRRRAVPGRADRAWRTVAAATRAPWSPPASGTAAATFGSALFVLVAERGGPAIGLYRRLGFREVETQVQLSRLDAPPPSSALSATARSVRARWCRASSCCSTRTRRRRSDGVVDGARRRPAFRASRPIPATRTGRTSPSRSPSGGGFEVAEAGLRAVFEGWDLAGRGLAATVGSPVLFGGHRGRWVLARQIVPSRPLLTLHAAVHRALQLHVPGRRGGRADAPRTPGPRMSRSRAA